VNIKKQAYEMVKRRLTDDLSRAQAKVRSNKLAFKALAEEQTRLKRERGILGQALRDLTANEKRDKKAQGPND
jgi:hypothetical protein